MNDPILDQVRRQLDAAKGSWPAIARVTGVPYFTIANICSGKSANPGIKTLQPLLDYFGIAAKVSPAHVGDVL